MMQALKIFLLRSTVFYVFLTILIVLFAIGFVGGLPMSTAVEN